MKGLKYFRPPPDVDDDFKEMKNLNNLEELNLRGCFDLNGKFIKKFNPNISSLRVLKISKTTLHTMQGMFLLRLRGFQKFQYIELSSDFPPLKTRRIYKDEIEQWLREDIF